MPTMCFLKLAAQSSSPAIRNFIIESVRGQVAALVRRAKADLRSDNHFCSAPDCDDVVVNATFSAPPLESRVRCGKNGVISNSIFSRVEVSATGFALDNST